MQSILFLLWVFFCIFPHSLIATELSYTKYSMIESYSIIENDYPTIIIQITPKQGYYIPWKNPKNPEESSILLNWKKLPDGFLGDWKENPPERLQSTTIGYKEPLTLLMKSKTPYQSPLLVEGTIEWWVCNHECKVESAPISLTLSKDNPKKYTKKLPEFPIPFPSIWKAKFRPTQKNLILDIEAENLLIYDFFPENPEIEPDPPDIVQINEDRWNLQLKWKRKADIEFVTGLLVTNYGTYEITFTPESLLYFFQAIFYAFLGGIILNLMPCVFPVLAMKAMTIIQKDHRKDSFFYTLGVLSFFIIIFIVFYLLREGGSSLGWGFQLQNPYFVFFLVLLFVFLGFLMLGWLEFTVGVSGSLAKFSGNKSAWGSFLSGAIAVLVASPCTAPFMGTALAYAMSETFWVGLTVFLFLGLGMAAPLALLQNFPYLAEYIPKPGPWMVTIKEFLAFPLFLTAIWLLWVLSGITSRNIGFLALGGIVTVLWLVWMFKKSNHSLAKAVFMSLFVGLIVSLFSLVGWKDSKDSITTGYGMKNQVNYSEETLTQALHLEKPVFLYFTADWCVTCKFNEANVLKNPKLEEELIKNEVIIIRADYTNESEELTKKLASFGRNGVPLYVFYPKGKATPPIILPQILDLKTFQDAITKK